MRILNTILAMLVAVLVVLFAVSNRTPVVVEIWPFPYQLELGLYALTFIPDTGGDSETLSALFTVQRSVVDAPGVMTDGPATKDWIIGAADGAAELCAPDWPADTPSVVALPPEQPASTAAAISPQKTSESLSKYVFIVFTSPNSRYRRTIGDR